MMKLTKHSTNVYKTLRTNGKREGECLKQRLKMLQLDIALFVGSLFWFLQLDITIFL